MRALRHRGGTRQQFKRLGAGLALVFVNRHGWMGRSREQNEVLNGALMNGRLMNDISTDVTASLPSRHTTVGARIKAAFKVAIGMADHTARMAKRFIIVRIHLDIVAAPL